MAYFFFLDESGQDQKDSPYEVLAAVAVEDTKLWPLILDMQEAEQEIFGVRYKDHTDEVKGKLFLNKAVFKQAAQTQPLNADIRKKFAAQCLTDGANARRLEITALAQAKLEYVKRVLSLCMQYECKAFASIISKTTERPNLKCPECGYLRRDYQYLFERIYYFLDDKETLECGILAFDEIGKSKSYLLIDQMGSYFRKTTKGKERSGLVIPEPFFVHSELTTGIQLPDFVAYIISWGFRKMRGMSESKRQELDPFVENVENLEYQTTKTDQDEREFVSWSFIYLPELCPILEKAKATGDKAVIRACTKGKKH